MENFLNILQNLKNPKILVVGDLMLDEYLWGNVDRISPEAPIPVLDVKEINFRLGERPTPLTMSGRWAQRFFWPALSATTKKAGF